MDKLPAKPAPQEAQLSFEARSSPTWPTVKPDEGNQPVQPEVVDSQRQLMQTVQELVSTRFPPDFKVQAAYPKLFMNIPVPCEFCKMIIRETANVLSCDACEKVFHLRCLQNHLLKGIPKGDWYCPKCVAIPMSNQEKRKYGRVKPGFSFIDANAGTNSATLPRVHVQTPAKADNSQKPGGSSNIGIETNSQNNTNAIEIRSVRDGAAEKSSSKLVNTMINGSLTDNVVSQVMTSQPPTVPQIPKSNSKGKKSKESNALHSSNKVAETGNDASSQRERDDPNRLVKDTERLQIEWIGDELQKHNGKIFYASCKVGGILYRLQECALFRPETPNVPPYIARLQVILYAT